MASYRYTREIQPEDLKPDESPAMTARQKRANFWFYNKWKILAGTAVALLLGALIWQAAGRVQPDYKVGLLSSAPVSAQASALLQQVLQQVCDDRNGDGQVAVSVSVYELNSEMPQEAMAGVTRLMADVQESACAFVLSDAPQEFPDVANLFVGADGSPLEPGDAQALQTLGTPWQECPALRDALEGLQQEAERKSGEEAGSALQIEGQRAAAEYLRGLRLLVCARPEGAGAELQAYFDSAAALINRLTGAAAAVPAQLQRAAP